MQQFNSASASLQRRDIKHEWIQKWDYDYVAQQRFELKPTLKDMMILYYVPPDWLKLGQT